ncbi:MAG: 50S ribosomal protein L6 [Spirochaetae bacterium HGW-Spirochaetae-4]|jgi:large subunit ribosomal protein L6|nr:50S ribosomal protein L6 [Sphaerochaeta sp.]OHD31745.1 MAG: 50S ribosomal protein L6 [Spirochaetes bacterium GWC2_52_13]OHD68230.1 MAG: 50S ribosomal protein L6 [Spirochaetes bacterium GWF2_52_7]PKL22689.1 MAG: 50S ribosomal protein L6 [Spirochaetae bacterium HGW-Spirochaetae-4]PKL27498.1 MAG: 50S ribosomal protein L6 [Spirochaetae bacterium HGW-Spirochaetae-2]
MSRIGKLPIALPKGITVKAVDGVVSVEGPKGKLVQNYRPEVEIAVSADQVVVTRKEDTKEGRSFHGLYRQLINNMIVGVSTGFTRKLQINGVGYRAEVKGKLLVLNLGYSTQIEFMIPSDVQIVCENPSTVVVSGVSKQRVGQISAEIRSLRAPEPYKGKGIKYDTEVIRRKVGKSGGKK